MVYMGSKTGEDPDDILKQNHQMLASVHSGRSELIQSFPFSDSADVSDANSLFLVISDI